MASLLRGAVGIAATRPQPARLPARPRRGGEALDVPWVRVAREVRGLLVGGGGRYRGDAAGAREPRRPLEVAEGRVAGPRAELPAGQGVPPLSDRHDAAAVGP